MIHKLIEKLEDIKLAIFDLDGVIYRGSNLIPNADKIIHRLKENSIKVVFNSNNSTATRQMYVDRLNKFNISSEISDFYTSASITSTEITKIKPVSKIYVIGEIGLREELKSLGHEIINNKNDYKEIDFVIVGLDREFNYNKLSIAQKCILEGKATFYATNADATLPSTDGILPGAGVMVNALNICTGKEPEKIFGKPNPEGIELILHETKTSCEEAVIFGDRLNTDILAGNQAGILTTLVLTGVTSIQMIQRMKSDPKTPKNIIPDLVISKLDDIFI
jgi:4-nitrophenyl phosphatase